MLVLALDTTTRPGSCAVASGARILHEAVGDPSRSQAERLPAELIALLEHARVSLDDVDVFAVATGPGSFTGLRIGIATMQGLAFAAGKPLVGVSGLDALAQLGEAEADGSAIATWVDAWRGEVYAARYERGAQIQPPLVAKPGDLLAGSARTPTLFIGDGAQVYRGEILARLGGAARIARAVHPPLAATIAITAGVTAQRGECPHPHAIRPLYVRRTDAELAKDARLAG